MDTGETKTLKNVNGILLWNNEEDELTQLGFCIIPSSDTPFEKMQSLVDDGIDTYEMEQIETPAGLFRDGAPYSVCAVFSPFSPQEAGFNSAESCQQFTNKKGSHPEEPFINLDEGVLFTNN